MGEQFLVNDRIWFTIFSTLFQFLIPFVVISTCYYKISVYLQVQIHAQGVQEYTGCPGINRVSRNIQGVQEETGWPGIFRMSRYNQGAIFKKLK